MANVNADLASMLSQLQSLNIDTESEEVAALPSEILQELPALQDLLDGALPETEETAKVPPVKMPDVTKKSEAPPVKMPDVDSIFPVKENPDGRSDRDFNEKQIQQLEGNHNLVVFEDDTDVYIKISKTSKVSGSSDRRPIAGTYGAQLNKRAYIKEGITKVVKNQTKLVPDIKEDKNGNWIMDEKGKFPKTLTFSNAVNVPMENNHQLKLEITAFYGKARKNS